MLRNIIVEFDLVSGAINRYCGKCVALEVVRDESVSQHTSRAKPNMRDATIPYLRGSAPSTAFAVPETTTGPGPSDEASHVKSPHSPTPAMFSAKYEDDGVTEKASAVDSSG